MNHKIKGWLFMGIALAILFYTGGVYRLESFSLFFAIQFLIAMVAAPIFYLTSFRLLGTLPAWLGLLLGLGAAYLGSGDGATSLLIYALCCATPLVVSVFWPGYRKIRPLAMVCLPLAGGGWLGGALLYCKLHFGSWELSAITDRISLRYAGMLKEMEALYAEVYGDQLSEQITQSMDQLKNAGQTIGFFGVMLAAYALFGIFFISVWLADRLSTREKSERWLGSWADLIPTRGVALLFMAVYLIAAFIGSDTDFININAVMNLFGFLFVFTAAYVLLQILRKKNLNGFLRFLITGSIFAASFLTVGGGGLLTPFMVLMMAGLALASAPPLLDRILK